MPPQRRAKILLMLVFVVLVLFYFSGEARNIQNQGFYQSTVQAMEARKGGPNANTAENANVNAHWGSAGEVEQQSGPAKNEAGGSRESQNDDDGEDMEISIAGRTKMRIPKPKIQSDTSKPEQQDIQEHGGAEVELDGILKRAPVIIFSKSYCPFSKRAKSILLDKYSIVPAPYVVELDHHPMGTELQTVLGQSTGRRTVPNVLVSGKSIGGGDEMAALDEQQELASTLKKNGGKWIAEVTKQDE